MQEGFVLHKGQEAVIDSTARFIACVCGIQSGKTTVGSMWLCREIWDNHEKGIHGDYLISAPTAKILEQSTLPKHRGIMPADWATWHEGKQFFELPWPNSETGQPSRIYVRSLDNPEHIEGTTLLAAWIDEAALAESAAFINIQGRLSRYKGRCILTSTPYSSKWIRRMVFEPARANDPDYAFFSWDSNANPAFPKDEYERARKSLPEDVFKRRYQGQFVTAEGLVYKDFLEERDVVPAFDIPSSWTRFGGLDFGHDKPTACICIAEDTEKGIFYVYRELYKRESLLKDIANFLNIENLSWVLADPQGAQNIAELNRFYGRPEVKPADNKVDIGIERIQTLLREGRLKFMRGRCPMTVEELENYHYPAKNDDKADGAEKPVKKNDHACDALKYAFSRQLAGLYPARSSRRGDIKARLAARRFQERDPFTGY